MGRRDIYPAQEEEDYETFMQQLEGDKEMRKQVNMYHDGQSAAEVSTVMESLQDSEGEEGNNRSNGRVNDTFLYSDIDEEALRTEELLQEFTFDDSEATVDDEDVRFLRGDRPKFEVSVRFSCSNYMPILLIDLLTLNQ